MLPEPSFTGPKTNPSRLAKRKVGMAVSAVLDRNRRPGDQLKLSNSSVSAMMSLSTERPVKTAESSSGSLRWRML